MPYLPLCSSKVPAEFSCLYGSVDLPQSPTLPAVSAQAEQEHEVRIARMLARHGTLPMGAFGPTPHWPG